MKSKALIYVPSDTPEAMAMAKLKIAGVPLIVRGIMSLYTSGFSAVTLLVANSQKEKIERFLKRFRKDRVPFLTILTYDEPYRTSPEIITKLQTNLDNNFLLINGNLLFDNTFIKAVNSSLLQENEILLCKEGVHNIPVHKLYNSSLSSLIEFTKEKPRSIESCLKFLKENLKNKTIQRPSDSNTYLIKRPRERFVAEKFLAENIRLATQGPVAKHINKRISLPISIIFSRTWISPHAITAVNIVIGLLSGVFIAGNGYISLLVGASLFQIASVADGVDGEVSKLTFRASKFGQFIDTISDNLALASCLVGLTIGTSRVFDKSFAISAGVIAIINTGIVIFLMASFLKKYTNSASLVTFNKVFLEHLPKETNFVLVWFMKYFKYFAMKDCFAFLIFAAALFGILPIFLFLTSFGTILASLSISYLLLVQPKKLSKQAVQFKEKTQEI